MSDEEPGVDLSTPSETPCTICGLQVPNETFSQHISWHGFADANMAQTSYSGGSLNNIGIWSGMPMNQVIDQLIQAIQALQSVIGTEGAYRFLRDFSRP